jgi:phiKZ-like phage internal head proteins
MSSYRQRGLVAAMESITEEETLANLDINEATVSAKDTLAETQEMGTELDKNLSEIENTIEDAEQLEDHAAILEDSIAAGGLDETAAQITEVAVEAIYARCGISNVKAMPAMEAFGSKQNRVSATTVALENMEISFKKIWESIKKAVIRVYEWLKTFLAKLFDGSVRFSERVKAMKAEVAKLKGKNEAKETTIPTGGFAKQLAYDNKVDSASVVKGLATTVGLAKTGSETIKAIGELLNKSKDFPSSTDHLQVAAEMSVMLTSIPAGTDVSGVDGHETVYGKNVEFKRSSELPGQKALFFKVPVFKVPVTHKDSADISDFDIKIYIDNFKAAGVSFADKKVPTLSNAEMLAVLAEAETLSKACLELKPILEKANASHAVLLRAIDTFSTTGLSKKDSSGKEKADKFFQKVCVKINSASAGLGKTFLGYSLNVGNAALDYVAKSAAQYK